MNLIVRNIAIAGMACAIALAGGCAADRAELRGDSALEHRAEAEVVAALARFRQLIIAVDGEQLADLFTEGGELSHGSEKPYVGRDAIRAFLKNFAGYKILEYELRASSTAVSGDSAQQSGIYDQTVLTPNGETLTARGRFNATWLQQSDGRWLLARMHTTSP